MGVSDDGSIVFVPDKVARTNIPPKKRKIKRMEKIAVFLPELTSDNRIDFITSLKTDSFSIRKHQYVYDTPKWSFVAYFDLQKLNLCVT